MTSASTLRNGARGRGSRENWFKISKRNNNEDCACFFSIIWSVLFPSGQKWKAGGDLAGSGVACEKRSLCLCTHSVYTISIAQDQVEVPVQPDGPVHQVTPKSLQMLWIGQLSPSLALHLCTTSDRWLICNDMAHHEFLGCQEGGYPCPAQAREQLNSRILFNATLHINHCASQGPTRNEWCSQNG